MTYSYAELKGKIYTQEEALVTLKVGQNVCVFEHGDLNRGFKGIISYVENGSIGIIGKTSAIFYNKTNMYLLIEEPVTWENLGTDLSREDIVAKEEWKFKVLGRLNGVVFLCDSNKGYTVMTALVDTLKKEDYTIVQPEPETPKPTREEILAKLTQEERDIIEGK